MWGLVSCTNVTHHKEQTYLSMERKISYGPLGSTMSKVCCILEPPSLPESIHFLFMLDSLGWGFVSCHQKRLVNKTGEKRSHNVDFLYKGNKHVGFLGI